MLGTRLSNRLTCRFLRLYERRSLRSTYFLLICRYPCRQIQLQALPFYGTISSANWNLQRVLYSYTTNITYKDDTETAGTLTIANEDEYNVHLPDGNQQVTFYYIWNMVNVIKIPHTEGSRAECA